MAFRKIKKIKLRENVLKPIPTRGWKPDYGWDIWARRGFGDSFERYRRKAETLLDARETAAELIKVWEVVEIKERES